MKRTLILMIMMLCLTATSLAADMSDVRGYSKEAETEYQYLIMGTYPYEEDGTEAPLLWRILGRDGDQITLFTEYVIDVHQVIIEPNREKAVKQHKFYKSEDFTDTDLFRWVNGEMAETILKNEDFSAALVEAGGGLFHILHNDTELRRTDWGFPDSTMGNTIENPGEVIAVNAKNRKGYPTPYAAHVVIYPNWQKNKLIQYIAYGRSSPYWTSKTTGGWKCGIVGGNGHLSWHGKADIQIGVRPGMVLDLTKLEITGGDGTIENPWRMAVKE